MERTVSELVAVAVLGDRVLHCVDFDRPAWFRPGNPEGAIVPDPGHFVADGLIAYAADLLGLPAFSWNRYGLVRKQFPDVGHAPAALAEARQTIYAETRLSLMDVTFSGLDEYERKDLARLTLPVTHAGAMTK